MSTNGIGIYTGGQLLGIVPDDPMRNIVEISYILNGISVRMQLIEDTLLGIESDIGSGAGGGGVVYSEQWVWNNQVALPPNNTQVRTDTGDWAGATKIFIDDNSVDNTDRSAALAMFEAGHEVRISQKTDANRWASWTVTGSSIDHGGYFEIPVAFKDSFGLIPNSGAEINVMLIAEGVRQTPWTQDIDAAGYDLLNGGLIQSANGGFKFPDGSIQTSAFSKSFSQTPWTQNIDAAGFGLGNASYVVGTRFATKSFTDFATSALTSRWVIGRDGTESGSNSGSDFYFYRYDDTGAHIGTPLVIKRSSGNVGIATSAPAYRLDVAGDCNVTGSYRVNGVPILTGAAAQTPWLQNIDAAGYGLYSVDRVRVTGGSGTSYGSAPIEIYGVNSRLAFHWPGVASQFGIDGNNNANLGIGCIRTFNNPGTDFEAFACAALDATTLTIGRVGATADSIHIQNSSGTSRCLALHHRGSGRVVDIYVSPEWQNVYRLERDGNSWQSGSHSAWDLTARGAFYGNGAGLFNVPSANSVAWSGVTGRPYWLAAADGILSANIAAFGLDYNSDTMGSGFYDGNNIGGAPVAGTWASIINIKHYNGSWGWQIGISDWQAGANAQMYFRAKNGSNAYEGWRKVISAGTDNNVSLPGHLYMGGYIFSQHINHGVGVENGGLVNTWGDWGDGYFRKMSVQHFANQLAPYLAAAPAGEPLRDVTAEGGFRNGWSNYGAPYHGANYHKSTAGYVTLRGFIKGGTMTAGTVLCVLAAGYRPTAILRFTCNSSQAGNTTIIDVDTAGQVYLAGPCGNLWLSLSGICFYTG